jgi:hypothetical protein
VEIQAFIVRVKLYNFDDKETGRHIEGGNLTVLVPADKTPERVGFEPISMSIKPESIESVFANAAQFCGKYATVEADFRVASDGKSTKWVASRLSAPAQRQASAA